MRIDTRHRAVAKWLADHQFDQLTRDQQAEGANVKVRTLYNWLDRPEFQELIAYYQTEWRNQIDHLPYVHRRKRLEELIRLYEVTPDSYIDKNVEIRAPHPITGEMIDQLVPVRKMNVIAKAKILEQIALEVGGDVAEELEALKVALGLQSNQDQRPYLRVADGNGQP